MYKLHLHFSAYTYEQMQVVFLANPHLQLCLITNKIYDDFTLRYNQTPPQVVA